MHVSSLIVATSHRDHFGPEQLAAQASPQCYYAFVPGNGTNTLPITAHHAEVA